MARFKENLNGAQKPMLMQRTVGVKEYAPGAAQKMQKHNACTTSLQGKKPSLSKRTFNATLVHAEPMNFRLFSCKLL